MYKNKFGVEIILLDGSVEWIDPVDEDGFIKDDDKYIINNGHYNYVYSKENVKEISKYPLCKECGYEKCDNGWCSSGCMNNEYEGMDDA